MRVEIIDNPDQFPQFEPQNVFQTKEYMRLFQSEKDIKVVLFAVFNSPPVLGGVPVWGGGSLNSQLSTLHSSLLLLQPLTIHRFLHFLPRKLGSYAVAWREPWRNPELSDAEAQQAFAFLSQAIEQYCRPRALYLEYRHFSNDNIYHSLLLTSHYKSLPWYNIYRKFEDRDNVLELMTKNRQRQLRQSLDAGVQIVYNPSFEQIVEWYQILKNLYRRIHRPLPSLQLFQRLNQSGIGRLFVVTYRGRVISGSALLLLKQNNSQLSTLNSQLFCEYYRASTPEKIPCIYPSVVATWQNLQFVADSGGGTFDFMGAGSQNKPYGVRDFKLAFGGSLTPEYRYRKYLL